MASKSGKAAALDACVHNADPCLSRIAQASRGSLTRMFVNVRPGGDESLNGQEERLTAVVDTGSTHTLIARNCVDQLGIVMHAKGNTDIVSLGGEPLAIQGMAWVRLQREGGPVRLPPIDVKASVVQDLSTVQSDVLIGSDVIIGTSGLSLEYDENKVLCGIRFGPEPMSESVSASVAIADKHPSPFVEVTHESDDVVLKVDDGEVRWMAKEQYWQARWQWKDTVPSGTIGHGIGEYSRKQLTAEQESLFCDEIEKWITEGWLIPHDAKEHGQPAAVLPLLAQLQEHKQSTPVRPCLDYRQLNDRLKCQPGREAPACGETLRKWRLDGDPDSLHRLDIRKAYLQVRIAPELLRFQVVVWKGRSYVMTRMGFGLNVAPKLMTIVVQWATREFSGVDSYIDDVKAPSACVQAVADRLQEYGLPTKPAEEFITARVLGLQLSKDRDGVAQWSRRDGLDSKLPEPLTRRSLASWCGRLTAHVPVCGWLCPACSFLKRMAAPHAKWDEPLPPELVRFCEELQARLCAEGDPAHGEWSVNREAECILSTDA